MIIAVDFDGTVVKHQYPAIGDDVPDAVDVLLGLISKGHQIILWTIRSGEQLNDAIGWFSERGIELFGVNYNPTQSAWSDSKKVYAHLYIDDAAFGAPLINEEGKRPYLDWSKVREMFSI